MLTCALWAAVASASELCEFNWHCGVPLDESSGELLFTFALASIRPAKLKMGFAYLESLRALYVLIVTFP